MLIPGISSIASDKPTTEVAICGVDSCTIKHSHNDAVLHADVGYQVKTFFQNLMDTSNWPARWNCGTWTDFNGWLYILSDIGIWGAYFAIPFVLGLFLIKRRRTGLPYPGIFMLFILFIFSCGLTHLVDAMIFWIPVYNFSAFIRFITAVVSIGTVFALVKVVPKAIKFKSPEELENIIQQRTNELEETNKELERTNSRLAKEIREKERARQEIITVIESIPQIAWTTTAEGEINYVNEQWWKYCGQKNNDCSPVWEEIFHPEDIEAVKADLAESIKEVKDFFSEGRLRASDGTYKWFLIKAVPIKNENNELQKWIGTFTDINDQKISEQRKDTFLNIASHELRTPLTVIRAYSELIARHSLIIENENLKTYTTRVDSHIQRLENLIMELLDVSRIGTGKMHYEMKVEDFDAIMEESVLDFKNINRSKHRIELTGKTEAKIICDKGKINQVVHNLLANAIRYSSEDKPVDIHIAREGEIVCCTIKDYGQGIPQEEIANIFKRFYRTTNNQIPGGLGLGLYISDEIIAQHNGHISARSKPGEGSTFSFCLPVENHQD